ncbi:MAG: 6,7-dimethyl-8-ribityllumazine synthase [Dehalococcoidia bacterium]|nr:6,7-dimethyl-8-ribityllumazine synthase [Chloroflexota bacterium]|tara:strand:+ start:1689 stop:2147 length:459 start_codon:yes stop_codon:yes gene_type:complete
MSDKFPNNLKKSDNKINCNITIIHSEFNSEIVNKLVEVTEKRLIEISNPDLSKISVPGAYEIPFIVKKIIDTKKSDAIICLGAIIRGETTHYELISENVFKSISKINSIGIIPVINGILTTENNAQAKERISNGSYFADSCLRMINLNKHLT